MENEFYDRLVYKKNAFLSLKEYLENNFYGKSIMLFTTKSLINNNLTEIMNSISMANCNFKHFVAKNNYSLNELKKIQEILTSETYDAFIVFGAGKACNVVKYFSSVFCIPYIVCPSACSTTTYFSNICINPFDSTKSFVCNYPEKIYISDSVIRACPTKLTKQGVFHILSIHELISATVIENILFDKHIEVGDLTKILDKLKNEIRTIMTGDNDQKLKLMDMLIELAYNLENVDMLKNSTFNMYCILNKIFEERNEPIGSGELLLICSKVLILSYIKLFEQKKINQVEFPNFRKIIKNIKKYAIYCKKINNLAFFKQILEQKELITRTNNLKEEFCYQCKKRLNEQQEILNIIKLYDSFFTYQAPKISYVFSAMNMLPYVCENNFIVSLIGGMGLVNAF